MSVVTRRTPKKVLVVKSKRTHLEESKLTRRLTLDTFADGLLKFRANETVENGEGGATCDIAADRPDASRLLLDPDKGNKDESFFSKKYTAKQFESSCVVALTTVANLRTTPTATHIKSNLETYVQKVFHLSESQYKSLSSEAKKMKSPELALVVKVISAEGLMAKDANGKSDPYCKLAILSRKYQEHPQVQKKDMADWQKAGLIARIEQTEVKEKTLEPVWNESVKLEIKDPDEDLLAIEIWDSDEEQDMNITKIRGLKGLGNFITDLRKGVDDFMGRAFYLLRTIPSAGETRTLDLYSRSAKSKCGTIKLKLHIGGRRRGLTPERAMEEYAVLARAVVDYESKLDGQYAQKWNARLSDCAITLLKQHAETSGVNPLQHATVLLSILLDYHKRNFVQISSFCEVIMLIKSARLHLSEDVLDGKEIKDLWVSALFANLHELASYIFDVMKNHLLVFDIRTSQGKKQLEAHLMTLRELYSFKAFTRRLEEKQKSLRTAVETTIIAAVTTAFTHFTKTIEPLLDDPEERIRTFKGLVVFWLHQAEHCIKLAPFFKEIKVDYMTVFFRSLDPLLCGEITWLEKFKSSKPESHMVTFELYLTIREIANLTQHAEESVAKELKIWQHHSNFRTMVTDWINVAHARCREKIDKAISYDKVIEVTDGASFSSSAVDTTGFLMQIGSFWKLLNWPTAAESYSYTAVIIQNIRDCALYYVGQIYTRVKREDIYKDGMFHASEKLCIILNNMYHLKQALAALNERLDLNSYYQWLDEQDKTAEDSEKVGKRAREVITSLLNNADEDIQNKISLIAQQISEKLVPDTEKFLNDMSASTKTTPDEDIVAPLMDYLTANLQTFGNYLLHPVLCCVLVNLWNMTMSSLSKCLLTISKKSGSGPLSARLYFVLQMLREFFHAGGNGLMPKDLDTPEYQELLGNLELFKLPTKELVLRFQSQLCQRCSEEKDRASRGTLVVSVGYLEYKRSVEVTVMAGQALPGMDKTGLSDPFVELSLLPDYLFPEKQVRTSTKKQTIDPVYNEEFLLPVKNPQHMNEEGAILMMAVFDYDTFGTNDLCGLCVVPCKKIPKLGRSTLNNPNAPVRKNFHLPLFLVQETPAFKELESRYHRGDSDAQSFFKTYKLYLGDLHTGSTRGKRSLRKQ